MGAFDSSRSQADDSMKETEKGSPDREVSPKFVYGSKKYGRRSRPRNDDSSAPLDDNDENLNYSNKITYNTAVQRSNSQSDAMHSKKRKTNTKLKRCTSFPGSHEVVLANNLNHNDQEFVCTEEMLRKAWEKLGVGEDGFLNQNELILVCDAIGLHRLANGVIRQLSKRLELDVDHRISFQELLVALQQDDTWSDVLETPPESNHSLRLNMECLTDTSLFPDHKTVQHITLGPAGTGFVNVDLISEMWEGVGISSPKVLHNILVGK